MSKTSTLWGQFLKDNVELREEIVSTLAGGRPSRWESVAIQLSKGEGRINCPWVDDIKSKNNTPFTQSQAFVEKLHTDTRLNITVEQFAEACDASGMGLLAQKIKKMIQ